MPHQALPYYPLKHARVHEVCGPGSVAFASVLMARLEGKLLWVRAAHSSEYPNPLGLAAFIDPARLLVANASAQADRLAVAEEALRDGSLCLVVIDIEKPLNLTAGRRLQIAAKTGGTTGLCLIPDGMGSLAAETRWHCTPIWDPANANAKTKGNANAKGGDSTLARWSLIKNKSGTNGSWYVQWDLTARCLTVVSPAGE